ncbi:FACT complex subunit [Trichoglossum hirsutum]|uniref:FACT complex subunit POB3 n=1 Tax=Trichoglossum hirsutum TaxID=265104 RepID=A0A9P8L8U2_9PEZI|nr:FACT complex subunit [Trichoglossum hirsutum]
MGEGVIRGGLSGPESFENIYFDLSKQPGKCRFAETGLGWKPAGGGDTFTLDATNIASAQWSRASRGFELKVFSRTSGIHQLDGFLQEDFERLSKIFKHSYSVNLEHREHALRGWNWGKGDFTKSELAFTVQNKPAFEIPYSEISNTNLAGKNEVAVEFSLPANGEDTGTNGHLGGARGRGKKAGAGRDQLVEMRFYIPGTAKKGTDPDGGDSSDEEKDDQEEQNAATLFYDTLMEKAEIGLNHTLSTLDSLQAAPPPIHLLKLLHRGRYDIDMYENSFRLRGKTYDYKIQYDHIKKFMLLPKPDDLHTLITIGLEPPLRQGQTRYPFLVMQFKRDEEVEVDLNMTEELLKGKYSGKLQAHYESPLHAVVAQIFRGLTGKKVVTPSKDFVRGKRGQAYTRAVPDKSSHHQQSGVKCSIKANEGHLYCLDKSFIFVPKPATYIAFDNISSITMSRVGGALAASRTFDITITLKGGGGEHQFSNINREEQQPLEDFFKRKGLRTKNEMVDDSSALIQAALADASDLASSADEDDDNKNTGVSVRRGSADEDEESVDEDFHASSESDVAEEYDSAHESSGSEGSEMDVDEEEIEERPKKKIKS